ncbi:uncharacterized protein MELLADRAFT_70065 [Melampsora larici-populina 98AG31]|uniref:Uncharacterized protein n=1 Tax=Melampsora larici-populina (strain 98AG31 / pathotype 3-4-7) TaxID=747676 RepID=F4SDE9_MELLP|nr:uncharacterized protein MELLADRAFT_70065 [Melampsora larici-populina 98AG31]EGF97330.1 hypothetical protein MELLADRAFT_70065 [Melampsora larici-populina 98AG31]
MDNQPSSSTNAVQMSLISTNREVAGWLPDHNDGICQSQTDWLKFLMKRTKLEAPYPPSPTSTQLSNLPVILPSLIQADRSVFSTPQSTSEQPPSDTDKPLRRQKDCWYLYRTLFYHDLNHFGIQIDPLTFDWLQPESSRWNSTMLTFVVKHWTWAKDHSAFSNYSIDPQQIDELKCFGILERWLRGKKSALKKEARNNDYKSVKIRNARHKTVRSTSILTH